MKKSAFTLIELIITVAIIALISGIFLANYYGSEPQSQLINATSALMRDLRLAQTRGATGLNYGSTTPVGWGININTGESKYILFADLNGNQIYDANEGQTLKGGREINLPTGVSISSIDLSSTMNISFYSDQGILKTAFADSSQVYSGSVTITLTEASSDSSKNIYINPYGLISSDL